MPPDNPASTLARKLGIERGKKVAVLNAPSDYRALLGDLPKGVIVSRDLNGVLDLVHIFARDERTLERAFQASKVKISPDGMIWASWPKAASKLAGDLTEHSVREIGLRNGLVDVKVCAVNQDWSALKFVFRVKDRGRLRSGTERTRRGC